MNLNNMETDTTKGVLWMIDLVGFTGEITMTMWEITPFVYSEIINLITIFLVIDIKFAYNIILVHGYTTWDQFHPPTNKWSGSYQGGSEINKRRTKSFQRVLLYFYQT